MASAFLEKIGSMAKNVTDKANDALEVNRINSKINNERQNISKIKMQLGEHIWTRFNEGAAFDEKITDFCSQIEECEKHIKAFEDEIQAIKEAQAAAQVKTILCPSCGKPMESSLKFCTACGTKLPDPRVSDTVSSAVSTCPSCGNTVEAGLKFCTACGSQLPELNTPQADASSAATLTCRNCGSNLKPGQNFCIVCGTKVE